MECYYRYMLNMDYVKRIDIEKELLDFKILFTYHSNKIENNETDYYDVKDIFENGKVIGFNGDPRTLFEIQNQKKCYDYLLDKVIDKQILSIDFIKEIHKILTEGTYDEIRYSKGERPGEFKKGDYIVGINEVGSAPEKVENDLKELIEEINSTNNDDYLTIGAYLHARFESIHPFADGNGRVGRTILNYYFMVNHIRPLIVYDEDKKLYYECLQAYDEKEDIDPLKKFLEYSQNKTWSKKDNIKTKKLISFL